ncbi:hypothetical protein ACFQ60_04995 [Streptomyces zhihengii]
MVRAPVVVGRPPGDAAALRRRDGIAARIDAGLADATVRRVLLTGAGGVGKSQLAAAAFHRGGRRARLLLWVPAGNRASVLQSYARAWRALPRLGAGGDADPHPGDGTPAGPYGTGGDDETQADLFLVWLRSTDVPWLIVLDDVDDLGEMAGLWPEGDAGRSLVTTRRRDAALLRPGVRVVTVGVFTADEAVGYLAERLAPHSPAAPCTTGAMAALATALGCFPSPCPRRRPSSSTPVRTCRRTWVCWATNGRASRDSSRPPPRRRARRNGDRHPATRPDAGAVTGTARYRRRPAGTDLAAGAGRHPGGGAARPRGPCLDRRRAARRRGGERHRARGRRAARAARAARPAPAESRHPPGTGRHGPGGGALPRPAGDPGRPAGGPPRGCLRGGGRRPGGGVVRARLRSPTAALLHRCAESLLSHAGDRLWSDAGMHPLLRRLGPHLAGLGCHEAARATAQALAAGRSSISAPVTGTCSSCGPNWPRPKGTWATPRTPYGC